MSLTEGKKLHNKKSHSYVSPIKDPPSPSTTTITFDDWIHKIEFSEHSFPEDYDRENGRYLHTCPICEKTFVGYKNRINCKLCSVESRPLVRLFAVAMENRLQKKDYGREWSSRPFIQQLSKLVEDITMHYDHTNDENAIMTDCVDQMKKRIND
jgi:hypothetical protein